MMNNENDASLETMDPMVEEQLYARHAEIQTFMDLEKQRGTPIPALFNIYYKFIQNPSSVSVETFKRMVDTDDTIGSGVDFLTTALASRFGQYQHPSKEITEWMNKRFAEMDGGIFNMLKEALSASWAGFWCGEKVWANTEHGFVIQKVVSLPPSTLLFEVDRAGDITDDGVLQYQRNYNPAFAGGASYLFGFAGTTGLRPGQFRPDPYAKLGDFPFPLRTSNTYAYLSIRIPKLKCIHYAFDAQGKFGNPYGRSLLRRIYKFYTMKDAFLTMLSVALDRKGTPLTVVFADNSTTIIDDQKYNPNIGARDQQVGIRADVAAKRAFENVHNDSTIILPGKKDGTYGLEFMPQTSNAADFISAIELCNKSIMRGLLLPSLIFTGGDGGGAYALGQEHAKTFDKICDGINSGLEHVILQQVVKEMLAYNFPKSAWEKDGLGSFAKRQLTPDEIAKEIDIMEKAVNIGAVDMSDLKDLNSVRDKLGLEPRDMIIEHADPLGQMVDEFGNKTAAEVEIGPDGKPLPPKPGEEGQKPPFGGDKKKGNPFGGGGEK